MAEGRFDFDTNIEATAERIASGLAKITADMERTARTRGRGGSISAAPANFSDRLQAMVAQRIEGERRGLEQLLSESRFASARSEGRSVREHYKESLVAVGKNMSSSVQAGLDDMLKQLSPQARQALIRTRTDGGTLFGDFAKAINRAIGAELRIMAQEVRGQLSTSLRRGIPTDLFPSNLPRTLGANVGDLSQAEVARVDKITKSQQSLVSAETQAANARSKATAEETKAEIRAAAEERKRARDDDLSDARRAIQVEKTAKIEADREAFDAYKRQRDALLGRRPAAVQDDLRIGMREGQVAAYGQLLDARIMEAFKGGRKVGELAFDQRGGEIHNLEVDPEFRRQGIATRMFAEAQRQAAEQGFDAPEHSDNLTAAGREFVAAVKRAAESLHQTAEATDAISQSTLKPIGKSTKYFTGDDGGIYMASSRRFQGEIAHGFDRIDTDPEQFLQHYKAVVAAATAADKEFNAEQRAEAQRTTQDRIAAAKAAAEAKIAADRSSFEAYQRQRDELAPGLRPIGDSKSYFTHADQPDALYMASTRRFEGQSAQGFDRIDNDSERILDRWKAITAQLREAQSAANRLGGEVKQTAPPKSISQSFLTGAFGRGINGEGGIDLSRGAVLGSLAQTAGTAARYSLAYGGFYQLTRAMHQVIAEFTDFQDSFTDYEVALGSGHATTAFTGQLEELSHVLGENVGAAFDSAARGIRAFRDVGEGTTAELDQIGFKTAKAAQMLAVVANKPLADATGDVISIGSAYELRADDLNQIVNAVSNAKRTLGGDPTQISQGLANIAVTAKEAGFSLQEAANIVSLVQSRTDQSGQAVATRLSRVFSIISGNTGQNLIADINRLQPDVHIDPQESLKKQIEKIAKVYTKYAGPELQGLIRNQLGGSSNVKELLPLLTDNQQLQRALSQSLATPGAGVSEYERKLNNFLGTLNKIRGEVKSITVELATADIFAPFAGGVIILEQVLHAVERLLNDYRRITDLIPDIPKLGAFGSTRGILTTAGEIGLGAAAFQKIRSSALVANVAAEGGTTGVLARRVASETAFNAAVASQIERRVIVENAISSVVGRAAEGRAVSEQALVAATARATAELNAITAGGAAGATAKGVAGGAAGAGFLGGLASGGKSLLRFATNPYVAAGLIAVAGVNLYHNVQDANTLIDSVKNSTHNIFNRLSAGTTREDLTSASASLRTNAESLKHEIGGISGFLVRTNKDVAIADAEARANLLDFFNNQLGDAETAQRRYANSLGNSYLVGLDATSSVDDLSAAMDSLRRNGMSAHDTLTLLLNTLNHVAGDPRAALANPAQFAVDSALNLNQLGQAGENYSANTAGGIKGLQSLINPDDQRISFSELAAIFTKDQLENAGTIRLGLQDPKVQKAFEKSVRAQVDALNLPLDATLTDAQIGEIYTKAFQDSGIENYLGNPKNKPGKNLVDKTPLSKLLSQLMVTQITDIADTIINLSGEQLLLAAQGTDASIAAMDAGNAFNFQKSYEIRRTLAALRQHRTADNAGETDQLIDKYSHDLAQIRITRLLEIMKRKESQQDSVAGIRGVRLPALDQLIATAGTDTVVLETIMQSADRKTLSIVRSHLVRNIEVAKTSIASTKAMLTTIAAAGSAVDGLIPKFEGQGAQPHELDTYTNALGSRKKFLRYLKRQLLAFDRALRHIVIPDDISLDGSDNLTAAQLSALRATAEATRLGGAIPLARAALQTAQADLAAAKNGSAEYYRALAAVYSAQQQLADAILADQNVLDQLAGDITDPLDQAKAATRNALRKLQRDLAAGKSSDVIHADQLALEQAQASQEQTAFQQRLSDAQTADELGRTSHQAYLRYLQHEHDRLSAIKNRTRQQQDQLDEIDKAMKSAADQMNAQFNLGNIDVRGLVYQTRRFAAQQRASAHAAQAAAAAQNIQNVDIRIDGADTGQIRRVLEELLNTHVPRRRGTHYRKTTVR